MKRIMKWLGGIIGSALTVVLVLALLPHASRLMNALMPDEGAAAIKASAIISTRMEESARLETMHVENQGVFTYDVNALLLGKVATISADYTYTGSFGIDLSKVNMSISGRTITFTLPPCELIADSLTPGEIHRDSTWYPYLDDNDVQKLLNDEKLLCREQYLTGEHAQAVNDSVIKAFDSTIAQWLGSIYGQVTIKYETAEQGQT